MSVRKGYKCWAAGGKEREGCAILVGKWEFGSRICVKQTSVGDVCVYTYV